MMFSYIVTHCWPMPCAKFNINLLTTFTVTVRKQIFLLFVDTMYVAAAGTCQDWI